MARKAQNGGINMSAAIREVLDKNPGIKAAEVVSTLAAKNIKVTPGLVYFIKGKRKGRRGRRRKLREQVANVAITTGSADALSTIRKIKALSAELGGLKKLKALVDVLSE